MLKSKLLLSILLVIALLSCSLSLSSCDGLLSNLPGANSSGDDNALQNGDKTENPDVPDNDQSSDTVTECRHLWINYVDIIRPTCGTDETGITESTCMHCGKVRQQVTKPYISHALFETVTPASCGIEGSIVEECSNCDYRIVDYLLPLTHSYTVLQLPDTVDKYALMCEHCSDLLKYVTYVSYEDFGAKGDGVTDDSEAIRLAHEAANRVGLPVKGNQYATYYVGPISKTIRIQTETDWNGARFVFDDNKIRWDDSRLRGVNVFTVTAERGSKTIDVPIGFSLTKGQSNVGMTFDEPCMLKIVNSNEKIYVRYGANANSGTNKYEMILVDEYGNVDPTTPIQYDYPTVTSITAYSINDKPISVGNATITTIAPNPKEYDPNYENNYCYFARGIVVNRSNTTLFGITHRIKGEDMTVELDRDGDGIIEKWGDDKSYGVPYSGFFSFSGCNKATMTDCYVQGHQAYSFWQSLTTRNEMGSYDINASDCINLSLLGITQYENSSTGEVITNRFMYHGVMGSNFCRNIVMDNCHLDRFDSHQGMHNARITNSVLGFGILVIGGGELYIENVYRISEGAFILLRTDYNSVFEGDLIIKNCIMGSGITSVINGTWRSFYNGLPNYMFKSVTIEGLTVESDSTIYLYNISGAKKDALTDSVNKLYLPTSVMVMGVQKSNGSVAVVKASRNGTDAFSTLVIDD